MKSTPRWQQLIGAAERWNMPDTQIVANQATLYQKLSWVHIAVKTAAQSGAATPFYVKRLEGEKRIDVPNHGFERLLEKPNPLQSRFEFLEEHFSSFKLTGNSYWFLNRMDAEDEPSEMWIIPPAMIQPVPDGKMYLKGYVFKASTGEERALDVSQIVHFKSYNPVNSFVGMSPIEAAAVQATGDMKMTKFNLEFYGEHNGRMPGVMAFADPINDQDWEKLKAEAKKASKERAIMMLRNAGKGGVEYQQITVSQKDMEYLAQRRFTQEEIYAIFAPGLSSMLSVSATEANAIAARSTFDDLTVWPLLDLTGQKVSKDILPAYGDVVGEFKDPRTKIQDIDLKAQEKYAETHTIDEVRAKYYGDEPLPNGRGELFAAEVIKKAAQQVVANEDGQRQEGVVSQNTPPSIPPSQAMEGGKNLTLPFPEGKGKEEEELRRWQRKAVKAVEAGKSADVGFVTEEIAVEEQERIHEALKGCKSVEEVREVFKSTPSSPPPFRQEREIGEVIQALREAKAALLEVEG